VLSVITRSPSQLATRDCIVWLTAGFVVEAGTHYPHAFTGGVDRTPAHVARDFTHLVDLLFTLLF